MNPKLLLPDLAQWDYFKDQVRKFGLVWQELNDGGLRIECFKDIIDGSFGFDDWTRKLIQSREETFTFGNNYGQRSIFKYSGEINNGALDETYNGWAFFDMDNDTYEKEKNVIESIGLGVELKLDRFQNPYPNTIRVGGFEVETGNTVLLNNVDALSYGELVQNDEFAQNYALWLVP